MSDDREHERLAGSFRVRYATVDELVIAYTSDLSRGGLFLKTDEFLPINAIVKLLLELPEGAGEIPVICRVAYLRDRDTAATVGGPMGMGLEFLDLTGEALQIFEHFIIELSAYAKALPSVHIDRRLKVVVIDDEEMWRDGIAAMFKARGDLVFTAADGFEGLALCLKQVPDVILTDVQMPRMDGWQLLRMIRARPSLAYIPVVFLTTLSGEEERLRGYQLGVDDYIAKPCPEEELRARIDRLVARMQRAAKTHTDRKSLRGDLAQVQLTSVLAFLESDKQTGELLVVNRSRAKMVIRDGKLLRVELNEPVRPDERFFTVVAWRKGQFEFQQIEVEGDEPPQSLTALIMEHARRTDEANR